MVAEAVTWVDVEAALREWARDFCTLVNRRVFFGSNGDPKTEPALFPQIVLFRIAGPDDRALIQFEAWAATKAQAAAVAAELATAADAMSRYVHNGTLLHGASVDGVRWLPDEASDVPRYIVDVTVFATASS